MRREDIVKALFYSSAEGTCDNRCLEGSSVNGCEECASIMFAEYEKELIEDFIKFATKERLCDNFRTYTYAEYYWLLKNLAEPFTKERLK